MQEVARLAGDGGEDEQVRGNHGDERNDVHEQERDGAVERLLPQGGVCAVRDALVEVVFERSSQHAKYVQLNTQSCDTTRFTPSSGVAKAEGAITSFPKFLVVRKLSSNFGLNTPCLGNLGAESKF